MGQSIGEYLVGIYFNPSQHGGVTEIKAKAADLIDSINRHGVDPRTRKEAIKAIELGAMWGVKSVTKPTSENPELVDHELHG